MRPSYLKIDGKYLYNSQYGAFLAAIGFMLVIVGVLDYPKAAESLESNDGQGNEENSEGDE